MSWLDRYRSLEWRHQAAANKAVAGPIRDFYATPPVSKNKLLDEVPIVALDFETTGLNAEKDHIISLGLIEMQYRKIRLNTAWHQLVRTDKELPSESVVIHNITDDELRKGQSLTHVLPQLLKRLAGKVMLVHYQGVEQQFLDAACRRVYGTPFVMPIIDTLQLGQRLFELRNHTIQATDLRLFNLRPRYNLPRYRAHNALTDAMATAELLLALSDDIAPKRDAPLKRFLSQ